MTPQEAFKIGFLARCVEENYGPEKIAALSGMMTEKVGFTGVLGELTDTATDTAKATAILGGTALLSAPWLAGGGLAYAANKASDPTHADIDEIKNQELIDEYTQAAQQLKQQQDLRKYKQQRTKSRGIYL